MLSSFAHHRPILEILFLSSNEFSGPIPTVGSTSIRGWYMSENRFTGTIPTELCAQSHLEAFFADENQLSGTIPTCVGDLQSIKQLYVFKNHLSGTVPRELSRLQHLSKYFAMQQQPVFLEKSCTHRLLSYRCSRSGLGTQRSGGRCS